MSYLRARGRRLSVLSMPLHELEEGLADEHERAYQRWNAAQEAGDAWRDELQEHEVFELDRDDER